MKKTLTILFTIAIIFFALGSAFSSEETTNLGLTKPGLGDQRWGDTINDNMDLIDSAYGTVVSAIDDLPEVYVYSETFNSTTGTTIVLPKSVDAVNEYDVKIVATSRAGAIGDIWVTKTTTNFVVKCSESNTTDTFSAVIYYMGDVNAYGGSIYRRWYVSPDSSITDHANSSTTGSLAWVVAQISTDPAVIELVGNKTYQFKQDLDLSAKTDLQILFQPGAIIDGSLSIRNSNYEWYLSGSGTSEYYLQASGGGNPNVYEPGTGPSEDELLMFEGTAGSLTASHWDWADNDSLGYSTIYVRLSDSTDPDTKSADYVEAWYELKLYTPENIRASQAQQIFDELGTPFSLGGTVYPEWWNSVHYATLSLRNITVPVPKLVGGKVSLGPGKEYIGTKNRIITTINNTISYAAVHLYNNVVIEGDNIRQGRSSAIQLAASQDCVVIKSENFDDLTGQNKWFVSTDSVNYGFALKNVRIDGNKDNQGAGNWDGIQLYGKAWIIDNVISLANKRYGLYSECGDVGGQYDERDSPKISLNDFVAHSNDADGIRWRGPHDATWNNIECHANGDHGIYTEVSADVYSGTALFIGQIHTYNNDQNNTPLTHQDYIGGATMIAQANFEKGLNCVGRIRANWLKVCARVPDEFALILAHAWTQIGMLTITAYDVTSEKGVSITGGYTQINHMLLDGDGSTGLGLDISGTHTYIGDAFIYEWEDGVEINNQHCIIDNLVIDGANGAGTGLLVSNSYAKISGGSIIDFDDTGGTGLYVDSAFGANDFNFSIRNCDNAMRWNGSLGHGNNRYHIYIDYDSTSQAILHASSTGGNGISDDINIVAKDSDVAGVDKYSKNSWTSSAFAINSTGEKTVTEDHDLIWTPNVYDVQATVYDSSGHAIDFVATPYLQSVSSTQVVFGVYVSDASAVTTNAYLLIHAEN